MCPAEAAGVAAQAAGLARADLATAVVMEMTALAGVMGRHYAQREGVEEDVAQACPGSRPGGMHSCICGRP